MTWTADELRQLRYRLGWSQAEMARSLNLELSVISQWETGDLVPQFEQCSRLVGILNQAESNADRVHRRPIAEVIMRDRNLSQIHDMDVIDSIGDSKNSLPSA